MSTSIKKSFSFCHSTLDFSYLCDNYLIQFNDEKIIYSNYYVHLYDAFA